MCCGAGGRCAAPISRPTSAGACSTRSARRATRATRAAPASRPISSCACATWTQREFFAALDDGYFGPQSSMPPRGRDPERRAVLRRALDVPARARDRRAAAGSGRAPAGRRRRIGRLELDPHADPARAARRARRTTDPRSRRRARRRLRRTRRTSRIPRRAGCRCWRTGARGRRGGTPA